MTLGSMTNHEYRQALCQEMVSHYKAIQALENRLRCKKYKKVHRDPTSDVAVTQKEDRAAILETKNRLHKELLEAFSKLPEVRADKTLQLTGAALRFAMELARKTPNPKYLKTQESLL